MDSLLSVGQEAIWLLHSMAPESAVYNLAFPLQIRGPLDVAVLKRAVERTVWRHEMLRSVFTEVAGVPGRVVCDSPLLSLEVRDVAGATDLQLQNLASEEIARPYDLLNSPPARLLLLRASPDDAVLVFAAHHIAMDHLSQLNVVRDLLDAYLALLADTEPGWAPLNHTYGDFVARERAVLDSPRGEELAAYWRAACTGAPTTLDLPYDRPTPAQPRFQGAVHTFQIPEDVAVALAPAARACRVTPQRFLLGAFESLFYRYTQQSTMLIGCSASSSMALSHRGVVGYFANWIPLRASCTPQITFRELARQAHEQLSLGLLHVDYPFPLLRGVLGLPPAAGMAPVQVMVSLFSASSVNPLLALGPGGHGQEIDYGGLRLILLDLPQQAGQFPLTFELSRDRKAARCALKYDTDLFDEPTVLRMADHFVRLLRAATTDPDQPVAGVSLVDERQRAELLAFATGDQP